MRLGWQVESGTIVALIRGTVLAAAGCKDKRMLSIQALHPFPRQYKRAISGFVRRNDWQVWDAAMQAIAASGSKE